MICQSHEHCKTEATRRWYDNRWYCVYHFLLKYRALEMNNDEPEAA